MGFTGRWRQTGFGASAVEANGREMGPVKRTPNLYNPFPQYNKRKSCQRRPILPIYTTHSLNTTREMQSKKLR